MGTVTGDRATVTPDGSGRSVELVIGGMTCASCAARVEKKLNKFDGVTATVNFATETARVSYPGTASPDELIAAVEQAGTPRPCHLLRRLRTPSPPEGRRPRVSRTNQRRCVSGCWCRWR
jgi:Cu+-exporting ATPase